MAGNIVWSPYQKAIFEDIADVNGKHTIVNAKAGSSKTSSLVEGVKYIPKKKKVIFLAFNKKIQTELDERIDKSYIDVRTIHSKSFATVKAHFGKIALDPDKSLHITEQLLHEQGFKKFEKEKFELAYSICRVVNLCKGALIDIPSKIDELLDEFGIDIFDMDRDVFIKTVCQVLRRCKELRDCLDYTDMIWYPYVFGMKPEQYDRVFIDELQDLSDAQLHFALSLCKKDGRILGVGDTEQVLYNWAGVKMNVIETLVEKLNARVLTLPISYRCAKNIVKLAQEIVPDIQAAPNAIDGKVEYIQEETFLEKVNPGDFILSRTNAPLIYHCLALLRMGVPANITGRDVGANLAYMIKKSETTTVLDFLKWVDEWKAIEIARLRAKNRDPILIMDKAACLETLCEGARSLDEVRDNIKKLFNDGDDSNRVILSSVHRAKGGERDRVFVLNNTLQRGKSKEADNIAYVAFTRAKKELYLVE